MQQLKTTSVILVALFVSNIVFAQDLAKTPNVRAVTHLDTTLMIVLDSIYHADQDLRRMAQEVDTKYGRESEEMELLISKINYNDSVNVVKVQRILEEYGWLGRDVIGRRGNRALFLVIQHADLTIQEKYLPMMREAVTEGNASAGSLALLEDRVAIGKGDRQIYGSQVKRDLESGNIYIYPLRDPDNVDKRRAEVGLGPMKEYASRFGIEWDVETYKKELPGLVERLKKSK